MLQRFLHWKSTQRALEDHLGTQGTWALEHSKGTWALRHSGTRALKTLKALKALEALYLADFIIIYSWNSISLLELYRCMFKFYLPRNYYRRSLCLTWDNEKSSLMQ